MSLQALRHQLRSRPLYRMSPIATTPRLQQKSSLTAVRMLSARAAAVFDALDFPHPDQTVSGVYDGAWGGSGEVVESKCPATGEVIGRVQTVSNRRYEC